MTKSILVLFVAILLTGLGTSPIDAQTQVLDCNLLPSGRGGSVAGSCVGQSADTLHFALASDTPRTDRWVGRMEFAGRTYEVEVVPTRYEGERHHVLRTELSWFLAHEWRVSASQVSFRLRLGESVPPTADDVAILERAADILASWTWDRADDRNCENDGPMEVSLYCALALATREQMGRYYHRQPALETVREVVGRRWAERIQGHRLMDFNNHLSTTRADLEEALRLALEAVRR